MTTSWATVGRIGVVGAGDIAHEHLASLQRLGMPALVYSPSGRAAQLASRYGARTVTSLDELLAASNVVGICTPTDTHADIAFAAIARGRHVICEKPFARTHDQAVAIAAQAQAAGRHLYVAHVVRYFAAYAAARAAVQSGLIGTPTVLRMSRTGAAPEAAWFHDEARSGGVLMDQMIHDFDFARWVAGEVTSVEARTERGDSPNVVTATATLYHANGVVSHSTGGWLPAETPFTTSFSVTGTEGTLTHSSTGGAVILERTGSAPVELLTAATAADLPFDTQLAEFATAIAGGAEPRVSAADGIAALDLTLAALRSARSGRAEPVRPV